MKTLDFLIHSSPQPQVTHRILLLLIIIVSMTGCKPQASESPCDSLSFAITVGNVDQVRQLLVEDGVDPNCTSDGVGNPLIIKAAYAIRASETVALLIEHGADVNAISTSGLRGLTALHQAPLVSDINWKEEVTENGELFPAYSGWDDAAVVVRLLIDAGADVNAKTEFNDTPLMRAVLFDQKECVELLLDAGADPSIRSLDSSPGFQTALEMVEHEDWIGGCEEKIEEGLMSREDMESIIRLVKDAS